MGQVWVSGSLLRKRRDERAVLVDALTICANVSVRLTIRADVEGSVRVLRVWLL
jgi:hypothetical protein